MADHTLSIGTLTLNVNVPFKAGRRGLETRIDKVHIEMHDGHWSVWSDAFCAEGFCLALGCSHERWHCRRKPMDLPHFAAVFAALTEEYNRHRNDAMGAFVRPALDAMETALAESQGSSVYFAGAGARVKIGWSKKVATRIAQLQTGNSDPIRLLGVIAGGRARERQLHEQFAHARLSGEWFEATSDLMAFIEQTAA